MNVIKRDDSIQPFDFGKIEKVVKRAFASVNEECPTEFLEQLKKKFDTVINQKEIIEVENIQDIIQKMLIQKNKYDVVQSFIIYRNKRAEVRESKSDLIRDVHKALSASDVQNQNANVDEESFGGRIGEAGRVVCKNDALKRMSKKSRKNHENNEIYIHDLDSYSTGMTNCLSVPIDDLLKNGFKVRQTDIRPAGSLNTALQLVAVLFQIQSLQQFGGVAATHIDHSMVPYVRKSFRKHYLHHWIMSLEEFDELDILGISHTELQHWVENKLTEFFLKNDFKDEDFKFNNDILKSTVELNKLHQKALFSTKKECYQGVEALYHNLNSLQSRSGCLMVKDCRRAA